MMGELIPPVGPSWYVQAETDKNEFIETVYLNPSPPSEIQTKLPRKYLLANICFEQQKILKKYY